MYYVRIYLQERSKLLTPKITTDLAIRYEINAYCAQLLRKFDWPCGNVVFIAVRLCSYCLDMRSMYAF